MNKKVFIIIGGLLMVFSTQIQPAAAFSLLCKSTAFESAAMPENFIRKPQPAGKQTSVQNTFKLESVKENFIFQKGVGTSIYITSTEMPVVQTSLSILRADVKNVFDATLSVVKSPANAKIIAGTLGKNDEITRLVKAGKIRVSTIEGKWEAFLIVPIDDKGQKKLAVVGSDSRGTAFGLLEISRQIGVSPWQWWADIIPQKRDVYAFPKNTVTQSPSVQYRGIFLNDEDWGLNPWSTKTFEPDSKTLFPVTGHFNGALGPKTYARIFELLLRLRANTIWPAMHEVTMPFYFVEGNRQMAEKYGIFIGSSHCEPLARNSATEWDLVGKGDYNYINNKENIISYWSDRLKELKKTNNIFTIGMRGKHDGYMQGVKNTEEYKNALNKVIADQTELLKKYITPDVSQIPRMLIPYKEVLEVYEAGLKVPDDVTLMWCDDNYGYITHFPSEEEQKRSGGNGVYYHASYWGRPHDYLWLGTASPALLYHQMSLAYEKNSRKIWILNVGDIKPLEYQTTLFLDMAWDMNAAKSENFLKNHLFDWLKNAFDVQVAEQSVNLLQEHYRLAYIRKPEFLGNTRVEEKDPKYEVVKDLPWSVEEINQRLYECRKLSDKVQEISTKVPLEKQNAFFELVKYPVQAAAQMNFKLLNGQLARHNLAGWKETGIAYDSIVSLTKHYNELNNEKWKWIMDHRPRNLSVFDSVKKEESTQPLPVYQKPVYDFNGADYTSSTLKPGLIAGLGYQGKAAILKKNSSISFNIEEVSSDSVLVEVRLLPNHPVEGKQLRFNIELNGNLFENISYKTQGRSEEWKENVLRNQALRKFVFPVRNKDLPQKLVITSLDEGVVIDQVKVYSKSNK